MTDAGIRDLGGSRRSLSEAIGRLDAAPAPSVRRASRAAVDVAPTRLARHWVAVIALTAVAIVAGVSLLAM